MAPDHWLPQLALGEALQNAGRCDEAVARYALSLERRPDEPGTYRRLGVCLLELRLVGEAQAAFEQLRRLRPESAEASNGLGAVALVTGDHDLARRYYEETLERDSMNVAAHTALAVLEENVAGDPEAALRHCEAVAAIAPETLGNEECLSRNRARIAASGSD
jgi:Flp pilus assembly protein TadD